MLTINLLENKELKKEIEALKAENERLTRTMDVCVVEYQSLLDENRYLKQKVKEYRHKTWFPVYEENLKLQQELEQYKTALTSVETFIGQYSKEKKGDKGCH
jgi:16S rRNA C1402 N4-methylase RsmH